MASSSALALEVRVPQARLRNSDLARACGNVAGDGAVRRVRAASTVARCAPRFRARAGHFRARACHTRVRSLDSWAWVLRELDLVKIARAC